jgi:hypothetical protein
MVELIVALAILGVLTAVVGLSLQAAPKERTLPEWQNQIAAARDSSLRFGRSVMLVVRRNGETYAVTALPDGRVIADASLGIDPLSGKVRDAER